MSASTTRAGRFRFTPTADRWWWSDEMFRIHGMRPGDVVPTTGVFLSHVHPEDRAVVTDAVETDGDLEARSCEYRLVDTLGCEHRVSLVLANEGPAGIIGTSGFVVDGSPGRESAVAALVNEQLAIALESRAAIDQAKGVLMVAYGVDDAAAFDMLRSSSQQRNVRLRTLATRIVASVGAGLDGRSRELIDESVCAALSGTAGPLPCPSGGTPLGIHLDDRGDTPTLRVTGAVDLSNRDELAAAIAMLLRRGRGDRVVVDLRGAHRIGPAAAEVIVATLRRAAEQHVCVTIVGGPGGGTAGGREPASAARSPLAAHR